MLFRSPLSQNVGNDSWRAIAKSGVRELIRRRSCVALDCLLYGRVVALQSRRGTLPLDHLAGHWKPRSRRQFFSALMPSLKVIRRHPRHKQSTSRRSPIAAGRLNNTVPGCRNPLRVSRVHVPLRLLRAPMPCRSNSAPQSRWRSIRACSS